MKKFLSCLIAVALMATTLTLNAFALSFPEESGDMTAPLPTESDIIETGVDGDTGIIGMPMADGSCRVRSWIAEQIRLTPVFTNEYLDGELYVSLRLSDATKIIFIVNEECPIWYDVDGSIWASDFEIPCGISRQWYRYLSCVQRLAAEYDVDGVTTLMANHTAEELAEMYAELREVALPYQAELIDWLDNYHIGINVPAAGGPGYWDIPQPEPIDPPVVDPVADGEEDFLPQPDCWVETRPLEDVMP